MTKEKATEIQNFDTLNDYIQHAIRTYWDTDAFTDFQGNTFMYRDVARKVAKLHLLFESINLKPGEKVALCGKNSSMWAVAFIAGLTYGAVCVPILHEFKPDNIHHLVDHSDARLLFTDEAIWENLDPELMTKLSGTIKLSDFSLLHSRNKRLTEAREHLNERFGKKYPNRFTPADVDYYMGEDDKLAVINYTSGSTGFSKGVMLSYGNLRSNVRYSIDGLKFLLPGDGFVSMLPLAHMFGLLVELLHPLVKGCHIYFLTRTPSPRIILEAFGQIRPKLIVTVPLVLEKIVKNKVFPKLETPAMKVLLKLPIIDQKVLDRVRASMLQAFGGEVKQIIIGGAGLSHDVEAFLRKIKFPYTVGYGMTECGPLVAYAPWEVQRAGSCGRLVDRMEGRIDSPDPENKAGELWVRGANVMQGYYKNPEATASVMRDGWMNTGDLVTMDKDGFLYIRGRNKNMILGPSGQNIYPEEIELKLNNLPYVAESLVVEKDGKLVALIYPDLETATKDGIVMDKIEALMRQNIKDLNKDLPGYSQIADVKVYYQEFEKTPKRSIKRYLYQ